MREKAKCSKSSLENRKLEPRSNDRLCRTLLHTVLIVRLPGGKAKHGCSIAMEARY